MDKTVYLFKYWRFLWQVLIHVERGGETPEAFQSRAGQRRVGGGLGHVGGHESWVLDSCRMFNYLTMQAKEGGGGGGGGSQSLYADHRLCHCARLGYPPAPSQWHFVNKDPLLWIRYVGPATVANGGVIATAILAPIHSEQRRNYRRRRSRLRTALSRFCDLPNA